MKGGGLSAAAEFDEFYRATAQRVVHLVYASTGDLELARDSTQEAYARAWQRWARVRDSDEPLAWVRTVARRIAISTWRKDTNRARVLERTGPTSEPAAPGDDRMTVVAALRRLGPEVRETIALHYLADLSIDEIARQTGSPPGTVKARLHRGRHQLATILAPKEAHDD